MKKITFALIACAVLGGPVLAALEFTAVSDWLKLPDGRPQIGNMHGDIAVSSKGEVYVSVEDPRRGCRSTRQDGKFLRNVPNAPRDFHGFVIRRQPDGEFIFGARLRGQAILKIALDGKVVDDDPRVGHSRRIQGAGTRDHGQLALLLTGMDVAPNGDLYVTDGYASDYIHRFDRTGKYLKSFGGKKEPYNFNTLHKLAIDTRFRRRASSPATARTTASSTCRSTASSSASSRQTCCCRRPSRSTATTPSSASSGARSRSSTRAGRSSRSVGTNTEHGVGTNQIEARSVAHRASSCRRTASRSTSAATSSSPSSTPSAACTGSTASSNTAFL